MREIKFRAWDEEMILSDDGTLGWFFDAYGDEDIMQFTGLQDKNGVDIYEGDIGNLVNERNKGVIKYSDEWAAFYFCGDNGHWWCDFCSDQGCSADSLEIIGNIYESPELLK